jgi:cytoskeletal protein RodZ
VASNSNNEHQRMTRWVLMAVILIPITAFVVLRWPQIRDRFFVQREAEESSPTTTTDVDASTASSPVESSDSDRESVVQESPAPDDKSNAILMVPETSEPETPDPSIANAEAAAKELQKQLEIGTRKTGDRSTFVREVSTTVRRRRTQ